LALSAHSGADARNATMNADPKRAGMLSIISALLTPS
jgi:hypothetical protein